MHRLITESGVATRRSRLFAAVDADWVLVSSQASLAYFAGFWTSPFVFNVQEAGAALLLGRDGSAVLFADNLVEGFAREAFATECVLPTWYCCVAHAPHRGQFLWSHILDRLKALRPDWLAIEATSVPAIAREALPTAPLEDVDGVIRTLRRRKDPDEVAQIAECLRIATVGLDAGRARIRPGMTEIEACGLVHLACSEAAGQTVMVYGDFATGPRTGQGGGPATDRQIEAGDLVLLDFSVVLHGYRGDFASTFVCGESTAERRERRARWFDACLAAMQAGEAVLRPGTPARDVHATVRRSLGELAERFQHHAGHGIGLGHPEPPFLVPESDEILEEGDVVTLEPGLYEKGVEGLRIERNYLITAGGMREMSRHALSLT